MTSLPTTFTAAQALTTLLTVESLLFAAFNAGFALTASVAGGRNITKQGAYVLAWCVVAALCVIAAAAGAAWWQVFGDTAKPHSALRWFEAAGIAVGILVQPGVAWRIALAGKPPQASDR